MSILSLQTRLVVLAVASLLGFQGAAAQELDEGLAHVNGVDLHYRTGGSGPPLLLLHGFSGAGVWWNSMLDELTQEFTVIVPDLPGHGRSTGRSGPYRYPQVARDLFSLLDHLGVDRAGAIGYSAGGVILLHMATQKPERVSAMALVSAVHRAPDSARESLRNWPDYEDNPEATREYWQQIHPGGPDQARALISALRTLAEGDNMSFTADDLGQIRSPTLLVAGDRDDLLPLPYALEMYDAIPDAELWVVPGHGHAAVWPEWGGSREAGRVFLDVVRRVFERSEW